MATTKLSNIINPQVMGDMIEAKINALAKLTPYAKVDKYDSLPLVLSCSILILVNIVFFILSYSFHKGLS